jgi:hypothetical protein
MKKKKTEDKEDKKDTNKYPLAEQMLNIIRDEYAVENERKKTIDSKALTFITVNIAMLTVFIPLIPFENIVGFMKNAEGVFMILSIIGLIGLGISVASLIVSFVILVQVAGISGYARVNMDSILSLSAEQDENENITSVKQGLVAHYHRILRGTVDEKGNCVINSNRADRMQIGIIFTVVGYVVLFFSTILLRIIVG